MDSIYFRTSFWNSEIVRQLSSRKNNFGILVYIFLITHPDQKPSGIFRFSVDDCAYNLGSSNHKVLITLKKLAENEIILYCKGWVFVLKSLSKSFCLPEKILSEAIKQNIRNQFKNNNIPDTIKTKFLEIYSDIMVDPPPRPSPRPQRGLIRNEELVVRNEKLDKREDKRKDSKDFVPNPKKTGLETGGNNKIFIDFAYQTFKDKFNLPLKVQGAKDGKLVKDLMGTYGLETLKELWLRFLCSNDEFILKAGKSIGIFYTQINKLISGGIELSKAEKRTLKNLQALEDF